MNQKSPLLTPVFPKIIIFLLKSSNPKYSIKIAREINSTYSTVSKTVSELKRMDLITIKEEGCRKTIKLTHKGLQVAVLLISIQDLKKKRF